MTLDQDTIQQLGQDVAQATQYLTSALQDSRSLIAAIYKGEDPDNPGNYILPGLPNYGSISISSHVFQDATANLLFSNVQTLLAALYPATPTIKAVPAVGGATELAEQQTKLHQFVFSNADATNAWQRAILYALFHGYAGLKLLYKKSGPINKRIRLEAIDPIACGWEPFLHRFSFHSYYIAVSELQPEWRKGLPNNLQLKPWETLRITEVYLHGYAGVNDTMVVFANPEAQKNEPQALDLWQQPPGIGQPIAEQKTKTNPIAFVRFTEPAPGEDVPPAEVVSWLPLIRLITTILRKIEREVLLANRLLLYDGSSIKPEQIQQIDIGGANEYWLKVSPEGFEGVINAEFSGVSNRVRPVERDSLLPDLVASLNVARDMLEEVTGIRQIQKGIFPGGRQTAAEVQVVSSNAELRNLVRREAITAAFTQLARAVHDIQRDVFGEYIELPSKAGIETILVPNPQIAQFAFRIDPVELGHLARRGDPNATLTALQILTQVRAQFRGAMPPEIRFMVRETLKALGIQEYDNLTIAPPMSEDDPVMAVTEALLEGRDIVAMPGQDHEAHMAVIQQMLNRELAKPQPNIELVNKLKNGLDAHRIAINSQRAVSSAEAEGIPGPELQRVITGLLQGEAPTQPQETIPLP